MPEEGRNQPLAPAAAGGFTTAAEEAKQFGLGRKEREMVGWVWVNDGWVRPDKMLSFVVDMDY